MTTDPAVRAQPAKRKHPVLKAILVVAFGGLGIYGCVQGAEAIGVPGLLAAILILLLLR